MHGIGFVNVQTRMPLATWNRNLGLRFAARQLWMHIGRHNGGSSRLPILAQRRVALLLRFDPE
jgi:hypothetical protein